MSSACGCTIEQEGCELGRQLLIDAYCGKELIESPLFLLRPLQEREAIWQTYHEVVEAYMQHCGYAPLNQQAPEEATV